MAYLSRSALMEFGFRSVGDDVLISDVARIYNPANIAIGNNVRVDDFCVLSAGAMGISIGNHVHLGCYCSLIGAASIELKDFCGLSGRVSIYSSSDDYSGDFLTNPTVPAAMRNVQNGDVCIGRHAIVGAGAVILPGVKIGDGAAIGSLTLVTRDVDAYNICLGVPARRVGLRNRGHLNLEKEIGKK